MSQQTNEHAKLSGPEFRRWITGAEVIASIFGLAILGMAVMGVAGLSVKNVEVTAVRVVD
jgi:hypothetical protein